MSQDVHYFKVGLFVIVALILTLASIIALGANTFFKEKLLSEVYFDESVNGLEVGSPVKYRGVKIGHVEEITYVSDRYGDQLSESELSEFGRFVTVVMAVTNPMLVHRDTAEREENLRRSIKGGMRVRIASQGITGLAYLEADYLDPEKHPPMTIVWEPEHAHVPSAPSTIRGIVDSLQTVVDEVAAADLGGIVENFNLLLTNANQLIVDGEVNSLINDVALVIRDAHSVVERVNELLGDPELAGLGSQVAGIVQRGSAVVGQVESALSAVTVDLQSAVSGIDRLVNGEETQGIVSDLAVVTKNLQSASIELAPGLQQVQQSLQRVDRLLASPERNLDQILRDLQIVASNLRVITESAKEYPAHVLFGEPPPGEDQ